MNNNDIHRVALPQHLLYHSKGEMLRRETMKRTSQRNKGMAEKHTKSLVSNISGKYWEELCMTGNEMATSDCLGGGFLACSSCMLLLYQACVSCGNRLQKKIGLMTSLRRLLITSWQRKDVWKTLFQIRRN